MVAKKVRRCWWWGRKAAATVGREEVAVAGEEGGVARRGQHTTSRTIASPIGSAIVVDGSRARGAGARRCWEEGCRHERQLAVVAGATGGRIR